jgi:hypothetical protein
MRGVMKVTIETAGGEKFDIPTLKKNELKAALFSVLKN